MVMLPDPRSPIVNRDHIAATMAITGMLCGHRVAAILVRPDPDRHAEPVVFAVCPKCDRYTPRDDA